METITLTPIGTIHTPHDDIKGMPIQPVAAGGVRGLIELLPEYTDGLKDMEGFSHITLVYLFHKIRNHELQVVPFMDTVPRGIFACRAPKRPNPIGISTVKLVSVNGNIIEIEEADMLNGTPLLDIKPFYPRYDHRENTRSGWLDSCTGIPKDRFYADDRFR
ncbi:MAG: tRNA (N6-threonylcarbamoyladenosine(37)-N6)-methyltransferase TrmO [Spirochaetota bacterium]